MAIRELRLRKSTLWGAVLLTGLLAAGLAYYLRFASAVAGYDAERGTLQFALNAHDHYVYLTNIAVVREGHIGYSLSNDIGIAALYSVLLSAAPEALHGPDLALLAFLVNACALIIAYACYEGICRYLQLGMRARVAFFANLSLLYFLQLINKDLLTVAFLLIAVYAGMRSRLIWLFVALPIAALVRQQLALALAMYMLFMVSKKPGRWILVMYVLTSIVAGVLSVYAGFLSIESVDEGLSRWLLQFNERYYIGYLLTNPLRLAQFFWGMFGSFAFMTESGGIDVSRVLRVPELIVLIAVRKPLISLVAHPSESLRGNARGVVFMIVSFYLAWLMNPTINARYAMLIAPLLVVFAMYVRRQKLINRENTDPLHRRLQVP